MGAGDGSATIRAARSDPSELAIALDASMDALRGGSRIALRRHLTNTLFAVCAIEQLPVGLDRIADLVTVNFPWGSLLRGIVCADDAVMRPLAALAKPGAEVRVLLSVETRDRVGWVPTVDTALLARNAARYRGAGLAIAACHAAAEAELRESGSSWAKRLGAGRSRTATALTLRRE